MGDIVEDTICALFIALFYLPEISECAIPLRGWVLLEWLIILGLCGLAALDHYAIVRITDKFAVKVIIGIYASTLLGCFAVVYDAYKSPQCFPSRLFLPLLFFAIIVIIVLLTLGGKLLHILIQASAQIEDNRRNYRSTLDQIRNGDGDPTAYLQEGPDMDKYPLFSEEIETLKEHCRVDAEYMNNKAAPPVQTNEPGAEPLLRKRTSGIDECSICTGPISEPPPRCPHIIKYPICNHLFHEECLLAWLKKKTTCPLCRGGIRSSLYKKVANGRLREVR